jgi:hypothetical protein
MFICPTLFRFVREAKRNNVEQKEGKYRCEIPNVCHYAAVAKHFPNAYVDMCWVWSINPFVASGSDITELGNVLGQQ